MVSKWFLQTVCFCASLSVIFSTSAVAFYEHQNEQGYLDARGLVRLFASGLRYPQDALLYPDQNVSGIAGVARVMVEGDFRKHWRFEINAYQTYIPNALVLNQSSSGLPSSVERSAIFTTSLSNKDYVHLALDRFSIRWSQDVIDLTLGRQAINLATTFYFTPNDFFAPFSAQSFYRVYKPGVDGLRAEISLGEFSQLSLIGVRGYQVDGDSDTGWSRYPDSKRDSYLIRWSSAIGNVETTLVAGHVVDKNIIGAALQGELFEWLGIRVEGHHANSKLATIADYEQVSFGVEHRWENSFELRWELFHNGLGSDKIDHYQAIAKTGNTQFFARRYSALGSSYDITPLLNFQARIFSNLDDQSHLLSFNTIYSLSDESELVSSFNFPLGDKPANGVLASEFGAYPVTVNVEMRAYF